MSTDSWVVLELNSKADGEDPDLIRRSITYAIKGADVFIPAVVTQRGEDKVVHYLVDGYAFVRHQHPDSIYSRLENSKYVASIVTKMAKGANGRPMRVLACITTKEIDVMRGQIRAETDQGIGVGDLVLITSGAYKQIQAKVIEELPESDQVQVHVELRSKSTIVTLPRSFLRLEQKAPKPPVLDRFEILKAWFNDLHDMIQAYDVQLPEYEPVHSGFLRYDVLFGLASRYEKIRPISDFGYLNDLPGIVRRLDRTTLLMHLGERFDRLVPLVMGSAIPEIRPLEAKYLHFLTIQSFSEQLEDLESELLDIEDEMEIK